MPMPSGTPALFTSTSGGPSSRVIRATPARTAASSVTSKGIARARPPRAEISLAIVSARSPCRSFTATAAPWAASARAMPAPWFWPAPVTSVTRPVRSNTAPSSAAIEGGLAAVGIGAHSLGRVLPRARHRLCHGLLVERLRQARGEPHREHPLGELERERRARGEPAGPVGHEAVELGVGHHAVHDADALGLLRVEHVAE